MGKGMPSARGMEWKGRESKESRENWYKNYDRISGKKKDENDNDNDDNTNK